MLTVLAFVIGAAYGSFLNMLLWRLPRGETIHGRSYCPHCHHQLVWYDLFPIFSYITLKGRCRYCHQRISPRYFLVELICAIVLALVPSIAGLGIVATLFSAYIVLTLLGLFFFDLLYFILPDALILPAIIITVFYQIYTGAIIPSLINGLLTGLFFAILYLSSRGRWLGFGDVKLALLLGLLFSWPMSFFVVVAAIWVGAAVGLTMIVIGRATMKKALPFGAFLTAAALVAIILQNELSFLQTLFR